MFADVALEVSFLLSSESGERDFSSFTFVFGIQQITVVVCCPNLEVSDATFQCWQVLLGTIRCYKVL
jgi:hypothetical protein